jgi:hypothetical protein
MNWIDTETKAILQKENDLPLAPPKVAEFALVMGHKGNSRERLIRAVCRINDCSQSVALSLIALPLPVTVNLDLTEEDAILGQFELVCCGAISAVVRSEVAGAADREYLGRLLKQVERSPEFKPTCVQIDHLPLTEAGQRFADQFLGLDAMELDVSGLPRRFSMPAKLARIIKHWAARIGAEVHDVQS